MPDSSPLFRQKLELWVSKHPEIDSMGGVILVNCRHDDWCRMLSDAGADCNCEPQFCFQQSPQAGQA